MSTMSMMRLRGEMELPVTAVTQTMEEPRRNIADTHKCPKCTREDLDLTYDSVFDHVLVRCAVCGHEFVCSPADRAKAAST